MSDLKKKAVMTLRSGRNLTSKNVSSEPESDEITSVFDVTEEFNQLQFENEKLKNNVSLLEGEADETLQVFKLQIDQLKNENDELKERIKLQTHLEATIYDLKLKLGSVSQKLEEEMVAKKELMDQITLQQQELDSKNEVINILREQLQLGLNNYGFNVEPGPALSFQYPMKTGRPRPYFSKDSTSTPVTPMDINRFNILSIEETEPSSNVNRPSKNNLSLNNCCPTFKNNKGRQEICVSKPAAKTRRMSANKPRPKSKVLILADSHGRNLVDNLNSLSQSAEYEFTCLFKPGACLDRVIENVGNLTKDLKKSDMVVIIGGSNNKILDEEEEIVNTYRTILDTTSHTNVLIAGIPLPHHRPNVSQSVDYINFEVMHLTQGTQHVKFLAINEFPRYFHTSHGLHLNRKGKRFVAKLVLDEVNLLHSVLTCGINMPNNGSSSKTKDPVTVLPAPTELSTLSLQGCSADSSILLNAKNELLDFCGFSTPNSKSTELNQRIIKRLEKNVSPKPNVGIDNSVFLMQRIEVTVET